MNFRRSRTRSRRNSLNIMVSTEKWRSYGRKISRRDNEYLEEDSEDDLPQACDLKEWFEEFFVQNNTDADQIDQDVEVNLTKKQTLVLSTLVPDEILLMKNVNTRDPNKFVGVLMMADVSGYTALSEKYNNTGKGGTYKLTVTLNTYLGSLIEVIYSHGGDIIKFAGDAFLALWKTDKRTYLCHTIHTAIACALIIQHSYGSYETDVKVNLKVKLAISAGNLIFAPIGSGIDMNYIIIGLPVIEAKVAESLCASGEVKLTPTAWGHCYSRNYDHFIDDDGHVTIKAILYDPRENDVSKPFLGFGVMIRQANKPFIALEDVSECFLKNSTTLTGTATSKINELLSLRKTILKATDKNIGSEIRKFMIRPVLTQIDAHQPLEYLTEMRQVSVLFLTLKPRKCPFPQLITIVNNSFQITSEIVYKSMGCVNKIILFDKDIMILVIFGLRGFKHESEAQAALKCACSVSKSVSALDGVIEVSIGVTTGQVYCGVVGHPLRREFTVIGATVNKAARLMCNFRNKITCDEATFIKSKMSNNGFTLQPPTELKGIIQPGKIYEYTEEIRVKELNNIPLIPPLLNRYDEMEYFENWIDDCHSSFRDFDALLLIGESRIGKTRLLQWMARYAKNKYLNVCYLSLTSIHSATPYLALSQIIEQMLGLDKPIGFAKEEKIVDLLKYYCEDLCYLNNILKVRFAYHDDFTSQDETARKEKERSTFKTLIKCISNTHVIFLDDLQNLDALSWELLTIMFETTNIFTVLTVTRGKFSTVHSWLYNVFIKNNVRKIVLGPVNSSWIIPLACQILDVQGVSKDLCNALEAKCSGMPGLVESFIVHLFSNGAISIKKVPENELSKWQDENLQFPDPSLLRPIAINISDQTKLDQFLEENNSEEISICFVTQKEQLNIDINVQNVDAIIMMQIDSLTPYQQLLLKIASVIGNIISRHLLENIMYENNSLTTAKAIKRLFAMRILSCANIRYSKITSNATMISSYSLNTNLGCECSFDYDSEASNGLPKYAFCKVMKFRNKNSRNTFYDLLPLNQKKEFHLRIVNYLENNKQKCPECGGTVMIVQSMLNMPPDMSYIDEHYVNTQFHKNGSNCEPHVDYQRAENVTSPPNNDSVEIRKTKSESLNKLNEKDFKTGDSIVSEIKSTKSEISCKKVSQCTPILKIKSSCENNLDDQRRSTKRVTMSNMFFKDIKPELLKNHPIFDNLRGVTEAKCISDWYNLGVIDSDDKLRINQSEKETKNSSINIEKGVSKTNYSRCTCADLNIIIYQQLIDHAKEAEVKFKVIEFLIKYSYLNVLENNFENALPKLDEAEVTCLEKTVPDISDFERKRFLGRIYSLKAASYLMSGRPIVSKMNIEKAARIYGMNLKKLSDLSQVRNLINAIRLNNRKGRLQIALLKLDSIFFLNVATVLYSTLEDERVSRIAALRSINLAQQINCNVVDLCDAFTHIVQMELDRGMPELTVDVEKIANNCLQNLQQPIQADQLFAVGKLLIAIFRARLARGELAAAIRSGYRALVISRFLHADNISIDIIPDLFYLLLSRCRIKEAVDVVKLLIQLGKNQITLECETWYYALSLDMILDAGFELESTHEISRFADYSLHKGIKAGEGRRRLVVGLWTYWLRTDFEHNAKRYENEALNWSLRDNEDGSLKSVISGLRLSEAMLESLARKMDDLRKDNKLFKVVDLMELRSLADRELARLEKDARILRTIYPRWILLKANSLRLSRRQAAATVLFNQALEEAKRVNNRLEIALALAANSNSKSWIQNARSGHFLHWDDAAENATKSWHQLLYKIITNRNT